MASRAVETARLSAHPRARRQIHRAKGWAALAGLVFGVVFARRAGLPWFDAGVRGLTLGVVAWLAAWGLALAVWTQLARAELELDERDDLDKRRRGRRPRPKPEPRPGSIDVQA